MRDVYLCAHDATPASLSALRTTLRLAQAAGARVVVLHVVEVLDKRQRWDAPISKTQQLAYKQLVERQVASVGLRLTQQLHEVTPRGWANRTKLVVKPGDVVNSILEATISEDASLVVLGRGRIAGTIAPITERVARAIQRPVLLVPPQWTRGARVSVLRPRKKAKLAPLRAAS